MSNQTPHYVIKRIGDQYIPVLQDPYPKTTKAAYIGWGLILMLLGSRRHGITRATLAITGLGLAARGAFGCDWLNALLISWKGHKAKDNRQNAGPSYQHDHTRKAAQTPADLLDEQAMESFPASDPPARAGMSHA